MNSFGVKSRQQKAQTKKHAARRPRVFERFLSGRNYFFSGAAFAGLVASFSLSSGFAALDGAAELAGFAAFDGAAFDGAEFDGAEFDGAAVLAGAGVDVFAGLLVELVELVEFVAVSPQAAPRRPSVKTAERAITFFISINSPVFFKEYIFTLLFNDLPRKVVFLKPFFLEHSTI